MLGDGANGFDDDDDGDGDHQGAETEVASRFDAGFSRGKLPRVDASHGAVAED